MVINILATIGAIAIGIGILSVIYTIYQILTADDWQSIGHIKSKNPVFNKPIPGGRIPNPNQRLKPKDTSSAGPK